MALAMHTHATAALQQISIPLVHPPALVTQDFPMRRYVAYAKWIALLIVGAQMECY